MHRFMSLRKPQLTIQYANKMTLIFALSRMIFYICKYLQYFSLSQGLIKIHTHAYIFTIFLLLLFLVNIQIYYEKVNRKYDNCII